MSQPIQRVKLAYGKTGLDIEIPESAVIIEPKYVPGLTDERAAIVEALRKPINSRPLAELAQPGQTVAIVHTDITRATPNDRLLPPLLAELESAGIRREDITLLNALGTHRPQTREELVTMLGAEIVDNYRCLQHDANDDANLVHVGATTFGHRVRINRHYMEADIKILTGFIEPHFFAGFSGGPKGVLPSIAGAESVLDNHGAKMIGDPKAIWGITRGNPIWEEMLEAAKMTQPTFLLNVAMNRDKQITAIFAGELEAAHAAGCQFVGECAMVPVPGPFDIVVTSNSGYPLDLNLYQTMKGVSAASQIVKQGGAIIAVSQCWDGIPEHGAYGTLLHEASSPKELLEKIESPGFASPDQWQAQVQARAQIKSDVYIYAESLTDEQITNALLKPCRNIEATIERLVAERGPHTTICVLPEGPITIPYLESEAPVLT
jgi:nickel-dependent lactate racemase